ncbi:two-component system sensor histidine kinase AgrC [Lactobacillus colini]|uniref:Two-component system sensor histidine kinase AgrC n=1 Tax=Lactobacillus colini TaxID=1819254 RepID=A0ABS4MGH6_9LACO|nr:GHKL domain-containing protein [Lactobacillus colini]MBP2058807.1 two-component system sensor histidine kinase AgrC [Lactobacillus colini]
MIESALFLYCLLASVIFDGWGFFKITGIKFEFKWKYIIFLALLIIPAIGSLFGGMLVVSNILEIALLTLFFKKQSKLHVILGTAIFIISLDMIETIFLGIVNGNLYEFLFVNIWLVAMYFLIRKYHRYIYKQLVGQNKNVFLWIEIYFYAIITVMMLKYKYNYSFISLVSFFGIFLVLQSIFIIGGYIEMVKIQNELLTKKTREELEEKYQEQKKYAHYLEKDEDELRSFRHDYQNMFNSLKLSAQKGNLNEVINKLDQFTENNLDKKALLKYQNLNHVKVDTLKSLLITKLTEMSDLGIEYSLECTKEIDNIPPEIDELDLLRIVGITLDNAIEECKGKDNSWINIMLYSDNDLEIEVRNSLSEIKPKISQLSQKGFTTKKGHHGLGLYTINQINEKYPMMDITYRANNEYFDFYLAVGVEN